MIEARFFRFVAAYGVFLLMGCTAFPANPDGSGQHQIVVEHHPRAIKIIAPLPGKGMDESDKAKLKKFIDGYLAHASGPFIIMVPKMRNGQSTPDAVIRLVYNTAIAAGVPIDKIDARSFWAQDLSAFRMGYKIARLAVPGCRRDLSSIDLSVTVMNTASPVLGCAVATNIAAMIADPSHISGPSAIDQPDAERLAVVIDKYRKGNSLKSEDVEIAGAVN